MNCIKTQNQCINTIIFPGGMAHSSYNTHTFKNHKFTRLIYIPFKSKLCSNFSYFASAPDYIPAILAINKYNKGSLFCIHFHGNACDIAQIAVCADRESTAFNAHYLIVEYPRFGISEGHPSEVILNEISKIVHDFVIHELRVNYKNVVLVGRSIGTGPACSLASYLETKGMPVAALILQSPYTSLTDVTADLLGCVSFFMLDRFPNWKYLIGTEDFVIKSPVLFVHADQDKIIDCNHSRIMHDSRSRLGLPCELFIQVSTEQYIKGHNYFEYEKDMVAPSKDFLFRVLPPDLLAKPLTLPPDVIDRLSEVPDTFVLRAQLAAARAESSRKASLKTNLASSRSGMTGESADSMKGAINGSALSSSSSTYGAEEVPPPSKCGRDIICYWFLCPCTFCTECCCAIAVNSCVASYRLATCSQPHFHYRSLKPADAYRGSLWQVLFRRNEFKKSVNEEDAAASSRKAREEALVDRLVIRRTSKTHRKSGDSEITNPILRASNGIQIVEEPSQALPVGTIVRNSDGSILTKKIDDFTFSPSSSLGSNEDGRGSGLHADEVKLDYVPG